MSDAPLTDFYRQDKRAKDSKARFVEQEQNGLIVADNYEGLERYNCCYCGEFCAIFDAKLDVQPKRSTDKSTAVSRKHILKQRLKEGDKKRIKRPKGIETQFRMVCPGCGLFVAYRSTQDLKKMKYLYICEAALTQKASVLHADGNNGNEVSPSLVSTILVPKSIQSGREPETVRIVVNLTAQRAKSCITNIDDKAVHMDIKSDASEASTNAELRRYLCLVLDRVRSYFV